MYFLCWFKISSFHSSEDWYCAILRYDATVLWVSNILEKHTALFLQNTDVHLPDYT